MSVGRRGRGGVAPVILIHDNDDKVVESLMVLFFGLVFSVGHPWKFFVHALGYMSKISYECDSNPYLPHPCGVGKFLDRVAKI